MARRSEDLDDILTEACRLVGEALGTDLAKVMELQSDGVTLLVRAGVGWKPGVVGHVTLKAEAGSSEGHALETGEPVASCDIRTEHRFEYAQFIKDHGVRALINVIIIGGAGEKPCGILQVDSRRPRVFNKSDIDFLRGYANLLAATIDRFRNLAERERAQTLLRESERRLQTLVSGIPQIVWRAATAGDWTWASPQWTDFTGQPEPESHGSGWLAFVHPQDRANAARDWREAIHAGRYEADYRIYDAASGKYRWFQTRATPVHGEHGDIIEWLGTSTDVDDLRYMQERQKVLVTELQHRTFNLLATVRSVANGTARSSGSVGEFKLKFGDRIDAMARAQRLLSRLNDNDRVTFDELIQSEMASTGAIEEVSARVTLNGPPGIALRSRTIQTLAMAIHELTTNAIKYGALKQPGAHLDVRWHVETETDGQPWLHVRWTESGVTLPSPSAGTLGTGQGRTLIERALPYQLGAKTSFVLADDGVRCSIAVAVSTHAGDEGIDADA
jgi:PAS domain S-box-containing protein